MNRINPIFEALGNVDERHIPAARGKKLANKLAMGLAAAAAVILAVGGGIVMLTHDRADIEITNDGIEEVTVKSGKYYLDGDVNSGLWIVVTPDTISLKGDDIEASLRKVAEELLVPQGASEQDIQNYMNDLRLLYCEEKPYLAYVVNLRSARCTIKVDRHNRPIENREDLLNTNAGFLYDDTTNKIRFSAFGDFILVE